MPLKLTPVVRILLLLNLAVFILQNLIFDRLIEVGWFQRNFGLVPYQFLVEFKFWQIISYQFVHGGVFHLLFNLLMLAMIGSELEGVWRGRRFLGFYLFCGVFAGLVYLICQTIISEGINTTLVGASGALFGLLTAYGIIFGERVFLFMMLLPMKAKHFIWVMAGIQILVMISESRETVLGAIAHLSGMLGGFLYLVFLAKWIEKLRDSTLKSKRTNERSHLKLVVNKDQRDRLGSGDFDSDPKGPRSGPKTWH